MLKHLACVERTKEIRSRLMIWRKLFSILSPRRSWSGSRPMRRKTVSAAFLLCFLVAASAAAQQSPEAAQPQPEDNVPGNFVDVTSSSGIHFDYLASHTSKKYLIETMGGGVALFDYDND